MILGHVNVKDRTVETHRDSYQLSKLSVVSVRRPFFAPVLILGSSCSGFTATFSDLLHNNEITALLIISGLAVLLGVITGKLTFVSRDLRGSELASVIYGTYGHLNQVRRDIVQSLNLIKHEDV